MSKWLVAAVWFFAVGGLLVAMDGRTRGLLQNSFELAAATCAATLPVAALLATLLVKFRVPGRRIAWIVLISGLFLPLYLVATAWQSALGLQGWLVQLLPDTTSPSALLSGFGGAVFLHAVALLPIVTFILAAGLASVERELEEQAVLTANPWTVLLRVTWRRNLRAVLAASVWVFIVCLGEMTVTDLFQIRTFAEEIYVQTAGGAIWDLAGGPAMADDLADLSRSSFFLAVTFLGLLLLPAIGWCLGLVRRWQERAGLRRWTVATGRRGSVVGVGMVLLLLFLIGLPLGSLFYHAGVYSERTAEGYVADWSMMKAFSTIANAPFVHGNELLKTAIIAAAAASAASAVAVALGVWATFRFAGKAWAAGIAAILAAVPGPLVGLAIIRGLNQPPASPLAFLAILYDEAAFGFAPWLAQSLRVLPFAVLVIVPALVGTSRRLLEAATLDGAGLGRKIKDVFLPLQARSFMVGWLVAFVLAVGELPATVLVAPPGVTPLSVRIFNLVHYGVDDQLAGLVLFVWAAVIVVTAGIVLIAWRMREAKYNRGNGG